MQRVGYRVTLGYIPEQGTRSIFYTLLFNTNATQQIADDLYREQSGSEIDFVQSLWIDNSKNAQALTIAINGGNTIVAKANSQGYYPILTPNGKFSYTATTTGNVDIPIAFLNVFINPSVWSVQ